MLSHDEIEALIDGNDLQPALSALNILIAEDENDDYAWFTRGKVNWRLGHRDLAISDYKHALAINPDSGARHALELSLDVMNFFNPDLLNP